MTLEIKLGGKTVNIYNNGELWVAGRFTGLRQWESNPKRWSNASGQEISDLKGKSLEEVLKIKGFL